MCGICGIISKNEFDKSVIIKKMTNSLIHRGPDNGDVFISQNMAFGHRRLSIIDLESKANQPFSDIENRYTIVFNGEIYNYLEVKTLLNYNWKSSSDTEVILAAFIQWGYDCLQFLNGMFSFAIWDNETKELFIARDRLGVKPFYYFLNDDFFVFSSEIRSILITELSDFVIDKRSLGDFFISMATKTPNTIFEKIKQLEPGHFAVLKEGKLKKTQYYKIEGANLFHTENNNDAIIRKTRILLENSIKNRMISDVNVGVFLSGGIDSSVIVALMSKISSKPIETFSIIFDDKKFDESEYASLISKKFNTKHTELLLKPTDVIDLLPDYIEKMDSPTIDGINTFIISKLVAETGIKVAISGMGGDELFVGYKGFKTWKRYKLNERIINNKITKFFINIFQRYFKNRKINKIANFLNQKNNSFDAFYSSFRCIFTQKEVKKLLGGNYNFNSQNWKDINNSKISSLSIFSRYTIAELTNYSLEVLLKDTDQMSMAWSLEIREPFFDYQLIEFLLSLKDKNKFSKNTPKVLLVEALGNLLPSEIVYREKKGFSFPWNSWIKNELKDYCSESLNGLKKRELFNSKYIDELWKKFLGNDTEITWMHIWSLVILERWLAQNNIAIK